MKRMTACAMIMCAGCFAGAAAGEGAAPPEATWPTEWMAFGSYTIERMGAYGEPMVADLLPGEALRAIPAELAIGDRRFEAQKLRPEEGRLDLARLLPPGRGMGGRTAYLMAPVTAAADTTLQIGAGAQWWMQWWVDGRPLFGTLGRCGNGSFPVTARDHVFRVTLTKGEHVLAVAVVGNNNGAFELAITPPRELAAHPLSFRAAMDAGNRHHSRPHWSVPMDFAGARSRFQEALEAAATDEERAEALLAMAEDGLRDVRALSAARAAIRGEFAAAAALTGARADQKARAALGIGETWLLENDCAQAREAFARAQRLSERPRWAPVVQLAVARSYLQERNNAAARRELTQLIARADLEPSLQFDARLHLEALEVSSRVRPDHPRLFFNADTWPGVEARVKADKEAFQRLEEEARALPEEFEVKDWGARHYFDGRYHADLMSAALVYRVTREPALLGKIRKMLRATVDHYVARADFNAHVETRVGCLAALDWVWNDLPAAERAGLAHDLLRHAYGRHIEDLLPGGRGADRDSFYYMPMMHWYVGLATLDPAMDPVDYLRALAELGRGYDNHVRASFSGRLEIMKDRCMVTRVEYAFMDLPTPCWTFLHCWRSAVGPIPEEWAYASGIAPSCVLRNALGFTDTVRGGSGFRNFGFAHAWKNTGGGGLLYDNLGQFIYFFSDSQPEEAAIAACLRQKMAAAGHAGTGHYVISPFVTDLSGAPAPRLPDGLPIARHYPANGLVLMSSGFDPERSTYALFCCGGGALSANLSPGGDHFDTGHFTLYKKGYLAVDSGTRAQFNPSRAYDSGRNYEWQSVAHNTVLIRMPGEVMVCQNKPIESNSGGQRALPVNATVPAFETERLFAYAATDATRVYHPDKCAQMVRQLIYLPPDHFVVFDRVVSKNAEYPKTWLLHTANEPVLTGKEFRSDQENGRIFCRTLYPLDAVLEKIGGPGKEFWADGRNWPIPVDSADMLRRMGMADASDVPEQMGRWRVEVTPGAARTEDCFLHLIQVSDQTAAKMVESRASDRGDQIELTFTAGARTYTITLNKTGAVGGHIRIEEGGKSVVERALTREVMPQSGIALMR
ncbi:MAG: heparinase II/III family protein [Armatimonadetes bacterium]|nr:heparinase II/III family protein [Armatimonadota bacterium]